MSEEKIKKKFYKKWWFWVIIAIIIFGWIGGGGEDAEITTKTTNEITNETTDETTNETVANIGDTIKTNKFEITILSIKEKSQVGGEYINSQASEGGIYVAVTWQYKNISDKPIGSFSTPSINMIDKNNTKYNSDIGASSYYATEIDLNSKILSNLNPGITVKDASVFEISKELYDIGGWKLKIKADKEAFININ